MPSLTQDEALALAHRALNEWGLGDLSVSLKGQAQSWVFQVTMPDGRAAMLRLIPRQQETVPLQIHLLKTLGRQTNLAIPRPLHQAFFPSADGYWLACLFWYVPGINRNAQDLTPNEAARIGGFLASLHYEAQRLMLRRPTDATLNANTLFGPTSPYASPNETIYLAGSDRAILRDLHQRTADVEMLIGPAPEHTLLLHGDFLLQNIVFDGETVGALDFEMCGWGVDLYDLAPLLWQMKPLPAYERIADAFWHGYTQWRALPPREWLEVFIAARQGASVRWLIQNRHLPAYADRVPGLIRRRLDELAAFLRTGVLKRQ